MKFLKITNNDNESQCMYINEDKLMDDFFVEEKFNHETIPLEGLVFLFNNDPDSRFYVRQILWHRIKNGNIVKTEENEDILLDIVPDYYASQYPVIFIHDKLYELKNKCSDLIDKMYNMLITFISVVDDSILYLYYEDISRFRNYENYELLNYMYAFYPYQMAELFNYFVIPEYINRYYKVKTKAFRRIINYHESIDVKILPSPYINTMLDEADYIKSNNPLLLEKKKILHISDKLYNSLFINAFNEQKKYI